VNHKNQTAKDVTGRITQCDEKAAPSEAALT